MGFGISFCNKTLFSKHVVRFWPLWSLYFVLFFFLIPVQVLAMRDYPSVKNDIINHLWDVPGFIEFGSMMAFLFGALCAMAVFGYLYTSRAAGMMHALPLRRETLFFTSYSAGLSMLLVPNAAIVLCTIAAAACRGVFEPVPLLIWLGTQSAMCLFFYSFAVFCAMLTGHILALPAFYGILNFLVVGVFWLMHTILPVFLYGYGDLSSGLEQLMLWMTPLAHILDVVWWSWPRNSAAILHNWQILPIYAAAAAPLTLASVWVYRHRHVETAGDVVAVRMLQPLFRCGVAFCAGLALGLMTGAIMGIYSPAGLALLCLIWGAAGYLAAEMLIKKSFRVFSCWRRCGIFIGAFALMFVVLALDLTGFETRVPRAEEIAAVRVWENAPYGYSNDIGTQTLEDPTLIEGARQLHQAIVFNRENTENGGGYLYLEITYQLKSGASLNRVYNVPLREGEREQPDSVARAYLNYIENPLWAQKLNHTWMELAAQQVVNLYVDGLWDATRHSTTGLDVDRAQQNLERLLSAIRADIAAGTLGVPYAFYQDYQLSQPYFATLHAEWQEDEQEHLWRSASLELTARAENTLQVLRELGVITQERYPITAQEYETLQSEER